MVKAVKDDFLKSKPNNMFSWPVNGREKQAAEFLCDVHSSAMRAVF